MKKSELLKKLEDIYSEMEALEHEALHAVIKCNERTKDELGTIIQEIEDEGIEPETSETDDSSDNQSFTNKTEE